MAKIKPIQRLGWFSTGRDKAARDLLTAAQRSIALGEIRAETAFVFCNREPGESRQSDMFHRLVKSYGLPLITFSSKDFKAEQGEGWRSEYDREVMSAQRVRRRPECAGRLYAHRRRGDVPQIRYD